MEGYSALQRNAMLTGDNLDESVLSEISPTHRDKYCMLPLI